MNSKPQHISKKTFEQTDELIRLGAEAVSAAQQENKERGVANVYSINGKIYYETGDGLVSAEEFEKDR